MKVDPRFLSEQGREIFTGNELLVKGALETEGGVHLLGGYPGSPVAGYFDTLTLIRELLRDKGIHAVINNNEALSAAMLNGTQTLPARAMIVMKSVGVHVAADALALANLAGANPEGGAIVVYGDDPWSDSTQVASDSRYISKHLQIPVIEPSDPQEVKDFVDKSFKLSRMSELLAGYVLTTNLADGGGSVECRPNQYPDFGVRNKVELITEEINLNKRVLLPPKTWWQEESLPDRFERAMAAARAMEMNQILYPADTKKPFGFVTSGLAHAYLVQALWELGLSGEFPILKFGLTYPIDPELVHELAGQCGRIVVVEERRGFMEEQISHILMRDRQTKPELANVELWGKRFPNNLPGLPESRGLDPSIIMDHLIPLLNATAGQSQIAVPAEAADALQREAKTLSGTAELESTLPAIPARLPTFCPGCPHRDSSGVCLDIQKRFRDADYMKRHHKRDAVDLVFHGDTGCYTMLMFPPTTSLMHDYSGMGLGGGTGSGIDPFITNKEVVFMGDSTFFHSGQIAISQAVKFGQDITFIILDNSTTAMTGHQPTPGVNYDVVGNPTAVQDIEEIVNGIAAGADVRIVRADPEKRIEYTALLEETFLADGVKIIIADKECGITRMRRKRRHERQIVKQKGYLPTWQHMNINSEICRFCLACAELTGCPGLKHVETDYGRKMDTDVTWCVDDGACERVGACSSFERVVIKRKRKPRPRVPEMSLDNIPEPQKRDIGDLWRCCLVGVGGMGIGLATSIIVRAGHKEGYAVSFLDKKGMAIRNGGVVSQVVYKIADQPVSAIIPYGKADLLLGIDVLEAARALDPQGRTRIASAEKTAAVINTDKIQTIRGLMGEEDFDVAALEKFIHAHTRADDYLARDISRLCEKYLGSKLYANIMMLGFAFQKGLIPVSMHSMAWAIKDAIRADFRKNLYAFNIGRKLVIQPDLFQGPPQRKDWSDVLEERCRWTIRRHRRKGQAKADALRELGASTIAAVDDLDETLKRDIIVRLYDCLRWGGMDYARRYTDAVIAIYKKDSEEHAYAATRAVVHNLATAMLIKDGVFLAELSTSPEKLARDRDKYNVNPSNGDKIIYHHLWHPVIPIPGGKTFRPRVALRQHTLKWLRDQRWLRKAMPRWHRREKDYLARYEKRLAEFDGNTPELYHRHLSAVASPQCMSCTNARCMAAGCPLHSAIPQWTELAYRDRWQEASDLLHEFNNFPEFTARICPALCQDVCKQGFSEYPVQVKEIEMEIVDRAFDEGWITPQTPAKKTGKSVAIIGSGPAGLAAAQQLVRAGHDVIVYEKEQTVGGLLRFGIPGYRLEKSLIDRRVKQLTAEGVVFKTGLAVGRDIAADELAKQHDAVLLATGAAKPRNLEVPGRELEGIHYALDFLRQYNNGGNGPIDVKDKTVAVIGGGLTGEDCVEVAIKCGAAAVNQFEILPQPEQEPLAELGNEEQHAAPEDRIVRRFSVATKQFIGNGRVNGVQGARLRWVQGAKGKLMKELPGSKFTVDADVVLLAMGFEPMPGADLITQLKMAATPAGKPILKGVASTAAGVFVAGDAETGAAYVATAINSGRQAAEAIDGYLAK